MIRRIRLQCRAPQDQEAWQKQYYGHQKHWQRRRLLALKAVWDGQSLAEVCRQQKVRRQTLTHWLDNYLHGGFNALLVRAPVHRAQLLSAQRQSIVRYIMLHKTPADYGIDSYQWTAARVSAVIEQKWHIKVSSARLYQLFDQWGLSLQKAHRDYGPANAQEQAQFITDLKKTAQLSEDSALIALDEFALQSTPYTHYAWAEKNTKPKIPSDECHRQKLNGFLTIDVQRGSTRVDFKKQSTTEIAVGVVVLTVLIYLQKGFNHLTFLLDNAKIHGKKMEANVHKWLAEIAQQVTLPEFTLSFWHTPSYSPQLNPAEYLIHEVRRNGLYQVPCTLTVQEKAERIRTQLARGSPMNDQQMRKLLDFIARSKVKRF